MLFWRLKSRLGRPAFPIDLQKLIRRMANETPSWGEERIANELLLKLDIRVSARTVSKCLPRCVRGADREATCARPPTATFRRLYMFGVIEHRSRRLVHCNITAHPSAAWTLQQLPEYTFLTQALITLPDRIAGVPR
jgi:putative transposase